MSKVKTTFGDQVAGLVQSQLAQAGIPAEVASEKVPGTKLWRITVIAKKFQRMWPTERQDFVWRIVSSHFDADRQLQISMILTLTPEEAVL